MRPVVDDLKRRAAVLAAKDRRVLHVNNVLVLMVGEDVCVVEGALPNAALVIHKLPRRPCVIATEKATVIVLEKRVDNIRVRA